jgi:hypothetical protein
VIKFAGFSALFYDISEWACVLEWLKYSIYYVCVCVCVCVRYCADDKNEENEMGEACSTYGRQEKRIQGFDKET